MISPELSRQMEASLAGCLLLEPADVLSNIRDVVSESDFDTQQAKAIYLAVSALIATGSPCDPNLILQKAEELGYKVSTEYAANAMTVTPTVLNAREYAEAVHERAVTREAARIGMAIVNETIDADTAIKQLQGITQGKKGNLQSPMEMANQFMDYINLAAKGQAKTFTPTGYRNLDDILSGGLVSGGMITIAARPGTGKTTVALNIAENVAASGKPILYVSLEMPSVQLWSCRVAMVSGLNRSTVYTGGFQQDKDWVRFNDAVQAIAERPFYIRDVPSTIDDIESQARCIDGLSLIIIDHMGLVKYRGKSGSRYEIMTDISHRIKQMAMALKVPIIALCQLNRGTVQRSDKRPNMADLRDSGAIEEDSDVVCLLYREAEYLPDDKQPKSWEVQEIDFIIDKNRHGRKGLVSLGYCGATSRISGGYK